MDGPAARSSIFSSAPVVAAIISGVTALLTGLIPWLFSGPDPAPQPAIQIVSPTGGVAPLPMQAASPTRKFNLTHGVWTITSSIDEEGTDFTGSTLKFTAQHEVPGGLEATGFFEWRGNNELIGREQVRAAYDEASRVLYIQGIEVDRPDRLAVGSFTAEVSKDGRQLLKGSWGNTPGYQVGVLGSWEARR
jgi:hypothetical protein